MASPAIGAYYPVQSFLHTLDGRVKILLVALTTVVLFSVNTFLAFLFLFVYYFVVFLLSDLPLGWMYKAIRPVFTILFIALFFQVLFTSGPNILFKWGIIVISLEGLILGLKVIVQIFILAGFASILSFTTTPIQLTDALESLLSPLKLLRLPVSEFALVMTIALRFIPQILTQAHDLMKAQKARGADFESANLLKKGKALLPIFIPLFLLTYRSAEELGRAMESRGYTGGAGRTHYRERRIGSKDYLVFVGTIIILGIALSLS